MTKDTRTSLTGIDIKASTGAQAKGSAGLWLNYERRSLRSGLAAFALALGLAACGSDGPVEPVGLTAVSHGVETGQQRRDRQTSIRETDSRDPWFAGAAVADEPAAALIARQVLERGGTAADAAAAVYFGLSVTYPAAAGLGGGGICLARASGSKTVETISFLTRNPRGGGAVAVPGNVRGFALLHARYGRLPWGSVVGPAERLAATGTSVSRATARQLAASSAIIGASPALRRTFTNSSGAIASELDVVTRIQLAATLAQVRSQGVSGFYAGQTAHRLVEESAAADGSLSLDDLRDYRPEVLPAQSVGGIWLPAQSVGAGAYNAALLSNIGTAGPAELADIARRTAIGLGAPADIDRDFGSTAFAVLDGQGGAVACAVTMNGLFGTGRVAEGTGIVFATAPSNPTLGLGSAFLSPVIVTGANGERVHMSGAGAGLKGAPSILSMAKNAASGSGAVSALEASPADAASSANAVVCADGVAAGSCVLAINPRGEGMGITAVASGS
ncbi:gamma-glutamyltranspeptidase [Parvibaculum lavamentivorans DS-1]|uniref:Gamma-glutamyltranspeptidase n=1 Tax=Parvibaculum lavamentivorans (strain DS-1 / DSM 13023 / NCIMB 13966) TaxID=402881 RepID=A7HYA1_PARL1|nr:gamma-glutamyltransferase [Parvibaculum lavamentivorans]ABS64884.1 gamma-glutamyltranspeptidase [Parvibaculum lavamentivorans DS-1]